MHAFAMYTPGHTPACMVHVMGNAAFVGDTLFMPDGGSARADFPGGDAGTLYDSIQKVLALPDDMRLFMCHDYGPNGRDIQWETTVGEEKAHNIHVGGGKTKEEFVKFRTERDATAGHAAAHHAVAAGQHARRRRAEGQGWPADAEAAGQRSLIETQTL
jgi:glyoxylase-like metal-dependent hydrolase (beta-lactamase superfamily II)